MNQNDLCLSCFAHTGGINPCPHCGFDRTRMQLNPQHLPPGMILNRNYLIGQAIGQGGFGITYIGYDLTAQRIVAIKEYFPNGQVTRQLKYTVVPVDDRARQVLKKGVALFFKEALTLAKFNTHPNVVNVLHFFRDNNTAYIVMEYLNGESLKDYLQMRGGKISFTETVQILCPIMEALSDLHESGLLHRDISPDNIFLTSDGHAKLLDFGAARFSLGNETQVVASIIKPGYAPLEQYSGSGDQGTWTDIYAMGATFYRCLTGSVPVPASERAIGKVQLSPRELGVMIPESVDSAIMTAMNMSPDQRFQKMNELEAIIRLAAKNCSVSSSQHLGGEIKSEPQFMPQRTVIPMVNEMPQPILINPITPVISNVPVQDLKQPAMPYSPLSQDTTGTEEEEEEEDRGGLSCLWILFGVAVALAVLYFTH